MARKLYALLAVALVLVAGARAEDPVEGLSEAETAQAKGQEAAAPVVSEIITEADPAELANGDGDVGTTNACVEDVKFFCKTIKPGEGRISACLTNQLNEEQKGSATGRTISEPCKEEMRDFKVDRATNINKDIRLATHCKQDVVKFCNDSNIYPEPGAVLTCLREVKEKVSEACQEEITRTQIQAAKDFAVDAMLNELCTADAEALCADVTPGGGRVQYCLRSKRAQLSWDCQEELFRQEVENADDIRLSTVLIRKCMKDKKKFCNDVPPGNARVKECLESKRNEPEFSAECKEEFENMMARRAADFRLDAKLRELCKDDIEEVCGYEKDSLDSIAGYDGRVIECLQDYKEELQDPACQKRVHKLTTRAASDIRFDRPLADACYEDRQKLCKDVAPGDARVIRCLQDSRTELSYECRATLFDQEVRLSEDIDFQYPMKKACGSEIKTFCKDVPHGNARIIQCLANHDADAEMSSECRTEVKRYSQRAGEDYRLNYRLNKACDLEIDRLCADVCSPFQGQACGGTVLQCLSDKKENITDTACKNEVFGVQKGWTKDYRTDAVLRKACKADVEKFCDSTEKGEGRVHECLRKNKANLSLECAAQELKLNILQSEDVRLRPGMLKDCSEEMAVYCKNVKPGGARVYKCLQSHMAKVDFSQQCRTRVAEKQAAQQSYYKLDFGIKKSCQKVVNKLCAEAKSPGHGKAAVLKCLVAKHDQMAAMGNVACSNEVSRAVRMALWNYRKGAALTTACDIDVTSSCPDADEREIGSYGRCLARLVAEDKPMSDSCHMIVNIAAPKDAKQMFDDEMTTSYVVSKVEEIERAATLNNAFVETNPATGNNMVTLTGWVALAAVTALVIVIVGGAVFAYRKYTGSDKSGYTLVVKGGDV